MNIDGFGWLEVGIGGVVGLSEFTVMFMACFRFIFVRFMLVIEVMVSHIRGDVNSDKGQLFLVRLHK